MDVYEIINRPNDQPVTEEEVCYVIEEYIFERKGVRVKINLWKSNFPVLFAEDGYIRNLDMAVKAFHYAAAFYKGREVIKEEDVNT